MAHPSVGRIVHYVSHGTPIREDGTQVFTKQCRAAIVTEVSFEDPRWVGLAVINPTGFFFHPLVQGNNYDETGKQPGSWHWPEKVKD